MLKYYLIYIIFISRTIYSSMLFNQVIKLDLDIKFNCDICKEKNINLRGNLPNNCTLVMGCPFNRKTQKKTNDEYIFKG